jgi:hypothetical protein
MFYQNGLGLTDSSRGSADGSCDSNKTLGFINSKLSDYQLLKNHFSHDINYTFLCIPLELIVNKLSVPCVT